nr:MAG TPA_asm: hypothetical protein [Caudoviricetes sp.]
MEISKFFPKTLDTKSQAENGKIHEISTIRRTKF